MNGCHKKGQGAESGVPLIKNQTWKSLRAICKKRRTSLSASMTVEASFAIPLFIFLFVNIMALFNILQLECNVEAALHQVGNHVAIHAFDSMYAGQLTGVDTDLAGTILGHAYVESEVRKAPGVSDASMLKVISGPEDIYFLQSSIMRGNELIDIVADYKVHPIIPIIGFREFTMQARYFGHAWTGFDVNGTAENAERPLEIYVYITAAGSVYHTDRGCSYLNPSIQSVPLSGIETFRSSSGSKYYPCESCKGGSGGTVYITSYGDRYHYSTGCSGLKRTIFTVPLSEVGGRSPCSKCGS